MTKHNIDVAAMIARLLCSADIGDGSTVYDDRPRDLECLLPAMNCESCLYMQLGIRDDGHCYMFREKPDGNLCGQFKEIDHDG